MGAGAAAIASMKLLINLGLKKSNLYMFDSKGIISNSRKDVNKYKSEFKQNHDIDNIYDIIEEVDVFIGLSRGNTFSEDLLSKMPANPIIFALANPIPEINPDLANKVRKDIIIATGRSDYPNQINNLICFPYIFRGLLDSQANEITNDILLSVVHGIRNIAKRDIKEDHTTYPKKHKFGKHYILPKPMDSRLIKEIPSIVSNAALKR